LKTITIKFNEGKQWVKFKVDSDPKTFANENKCRGWYWEAENRKQRQGLFGYIHLPLYNKVTPFFRELVAHEIQHLITDWVTCRQVKDLSAYLLNNDERIATISGEIERRFWQKYEKI